MADDTPDIPALVADGSPVYTAAMDYANWLVAYHMGQRPVHEVTEKLEAFRAALSRLTRALAERDAESQEFRRAVEVAEKLFQPGGKYHERCMPLLWGRSTVIDGMKWLDEQLAIAERERDEARAALAKYEAAHQKTRP